MLMTDEATATPKTPGTSDRYRARAQYLGGFGRLVVFVVAVVVVAVLAVSLFAGDTRVIREPVIEESAIETLLS